MIKAQLIKWKPKNQQINIIQENKINSLPEGIICEEVGERQWEHKQNKLLDS